MRIHSLPIGVSAWPVGLSSGVTVLVVYWAVGVELSTSIRCSGGMSMLGFVAVGLEGLGMKCFC